MPEDGGLIGQTLIGLKPVNAWVHTYTKPQTSSTQSRGLGWRIHESVEDTKLSTNKQHTLSLQYFSWCSRTLPGLCSTLHPNSHVNSPESLRSKSLRSDNRSLSHVHVHLLLLLLSAFSWPGASDPAPCSCHPHPHTPVTPIPTLLSPLSHVPPPYTPYARARTHTHTHTRPRRPRVH